MQTSEDGSDSKIIQCGSRSLNSAETRYAIIELEALAIFYAITKCKHFLSGIRHFDVITDHKPLEAIFLKSLNEIQNARLLKYRENLSSYNFTVSWSPGKDHFIADALSRAPVFPPLEEEPEVVRCVQESLSLKPIMNAAREDEDYQAITTALQERKLPKNLPLHHPARALKNVWEELSMEEDLIILDARRIFVPSTYRRQNT